MNRVLLTKLKINNLGPIKEDEVSLSNLTFFIGRNNAGKSHYLKAVELLLSTRIKKDHIPKWQSDKTKPVVIEGEFKGVDSFTNLVTASNHKEAIEKAIKIAEFSIRQINKPQKFSRRKDDWKIDMMIGNFEEIIELLKTPEKEIDDDKRVKNIVPMDNSI